MRKVEKLSFFSPICQRLSHNKLITTFEQYLHGFNDELMILREIPKFVQSSYWTNPGRDSGRERNDHNFFLFGPILITFGKDA